MKIEIEIPEEFEKDFKHDRFEECLTRLNADAHMTAGNYEKETAIMLVKALKDSTLAYDVDSVVTNLEKQRDVWNDKEVADKELVEEKRKAYNMAIAIVKGGCVDAKTDS